MRNGGDPTLLRKRDHLQQLQPPDASFYVMKTEVRACLRQPEAVPPMIRAQLIFPNPLSHPEQNVTDHHIKVLLPPTTTTTTTNIIFMGKCGRAHVIQIGIFEDSSEYMIPALCFTNGFSVMRAKSTKK